MDVFYCVIGGIGILIVILGIATFFPTLGEILLDIFQDVVENIIDD